jgi:glycosyltransferase involved in cell wall biosynthesis
MSEYRRLGKKIALSTILWVEYEKGSGPYQYVRKIFDLADILFTNSDLESLKLSRAFDVDPAKFHKTRNSISDDYLGLGTERDFRAIHSIEDEFILSVANIDRRKNTHRLVEACAALGKKLVLIGHVRDPEYFESFKDAYTGMTFLGPVGDVQVLKSAFQQCQLFALPSLCETPGIAALEAASQGAAVVITNEGPTREYFGDHARYVDPLSLDSITGGIAAELKQARSREALRNHVINSYTWDRTAEDIISGYRELLSDGPV